MKVRKIIILDNKVILDSMTDIMDIDDEYIHTRGQMYSLKNSITYCANVDDPDIILLDLEENKDAIEPKIKRPTTGKIGIFIHNMSILDEFRIDLDNIRRYKKYKFMDGQEYDITHYVESNDRVLVFLSEANKSNCIPHTTNAKVILPTKV